MAVAEFAAAPPLFYITVESLLDWAILILTLVLLGWAFVHALLQRADAFTAVGTLSKPAWLAILGGLFLIVGLFIGLGGAFGMLRIFMWIGIAAAAYYLLETRRGIKDVSEGPW
jgi:Protein of unknown function (DUF2516)